MNKILIIAIFSMILWSCSQQKKDETSQTTTDGSEQVDVTNPKESAKATIDYAGVYKGVMPCADCEGIEIEITLNKDNTYLTKRKYLGKKEKNEFEESGNYTWDASGNIVTLGGSDTEKYMVDEKSIVKLDSEGSVITDNFAEMYILKKEK